MRSLGVSDVYACVWERLRWKGMFTTKFTLHSIPNSLRHESNWANYCFRRKRNVCGRICVKFNRLMHQSIEEKSSHAWTQCFSVESSDISFLFSQWHEYRSPWHNRIRNGAPFRMENDSSWITSQTGWIKATLLQHSHWHINCLALRPCEWGRSRIDCRTMNSVRHSFAHGPFCHWNYFTIHRFHRHHHSQRKQQGRTI